ncbi:MAG TPA: ABC transporter substrate-binding protein [Candidatus Binatia bacterium]|jgi:NitT/TauT family transport system substrate-binding protein|nr:ABC transporter substrate-binding protein [Candidatus Binatia bacterium]
MRRRLLAVAALVLLAACGGGSDGSTVRVALNWFPEHEHGGYYEALAGGGYRTAGLDVRILPGGPQAPVLSRVASGDVEYGVVNADDVLVGRAAGVAVVAVMAPIQTSPVCVMVHAASGFTTLQDIRDVTLAVQIASPYWQFMKPRLPLPGVTVVPYTGTIAEFLTNPKYAQQAYVISEPILARAKGADPRCLLVAELGFNPYTSVLVTSEARLRDDPEQVRRMVTASAEGWTRYLANPTVGNDAILAVNPEMGRETLERGVEALVPLVRVDGVAMGSMTAARWQTLAQQLRAAGVLATEVDPTRAWDARFLPSPES